LLDSLTHLVAVLSGHHYISKDNVWLDFTSLFQSIIAIICRCYGEILVCKGNSDDLLNGDAIVCKQYFLTHFSPFTLYIH